MMPLAVTRAPIPPEYHGWWRITSASRWRTDELDELGPALVSITGADDRLRMLAFLANVRWRRGRAGLVFAWSGAWQLDRVTGTGGARLTRSGRLHGRFELAHGDRSSFVAERAAAPAVPIAAPISYGAGRGERGSAR